jgi:hypothetical protein
MQSVYHLKDALFLVVCSRHGGRVQLIVHAGRGRDVPAVGQEEASQEEEPEPEGGLGCRPIRW